MIRLPASLAPWSALLALLPPELAAGMGPWVERLVLAMGTPRAARPRPGGEPDGFSGITRRGSYERLLLTEWLLADEVPEEFARRATMGEHAFHEIARRTPARAATSIALFDAGPDQLGSPRIVQLAALIALAGRAEQAGVRFSWGMLHEPDAAMIPAVTGESLLHLLEKRTAIAAGDVEVGAWADRALASGWEDVWLVGRRAPPRVLGGPAWAPASIEAEDVLDPERRAVRAIVSLPPSPARAIELELPDDRACARLLRDPFAAVQTPPRRAPASASGSSNLLFASNGMKVFLRTKEGEIVAYPVPSYPSSTPGRPKRYRAKAGGVVAAVGWVRRGLVMLIVNVNARTLTLEQTNSKGPKELSATFPLPPELGFAVATLEDRLAPIVFHRYGTRFVPVTLDARGALYEIADIFDSPINLRAAEVAALFTQGHGQVAFIARGLATQVTKGWIAYDMPAGPRPLDPLRWNLVVAAATDRAGSFVALEGDGPFEALYGCFHNAPASVALVAVRAAGATWTIHGGKDPVSFEAPAGARLVGLSQQGRDGDPELFVIEGDQRTISLVKGGTSRPLARASSDILHFAQCTQRPTMAYATDAGEVVVLSASFSQPLARFVPPGGDVTIAMATKSQIVPVRPRRVIHRGVVEASAILLDASILGPQQASRRAVAAWVPGATLHRVGAALLVRLPSPRWIDCARAPGLVLARVGEPSGGARAARTGGAPQLDVARAPLCSAPLADDELAAARLQPGAALIVVGGALHAIDDSASVEPADLLDVSTFAPHEVTSLGAPPPAPMIALAPTSRASREVFGMGPPPHEISSILAALVGGRAAAGGREGSRRPSVRFPGDEEGGGVDARLSILAGLLAGIGALLAQFFGTGATRSPSSTGALDGAGSSRSSRSRSALAALPQEPSGPSAADRLRAKLMSWVAAALVKARLARRIGRRQAEYVDRMMEMFERGDLSEALRRAIPLRGGADPDALTVQALTVPTPRDTLAISLGRGGLSSSMFADDDIFDRLRAMYRKAFEQLEREGRIDEAAFTLAELLRAEEEAVAFLERHGRLRLAAELAEARRLAPGLVVRQWFLAGDGARAVLLARRHGAFADAIERLEKHEKQPFLRLLWADALASAGDFAAAVDVLWPIPESRTIGAAWLDAAIAQGGVAAARLLVRKLELLPDAFPDVLARALALLDEGGDGAPEERVAFAEALLAAPTTPALCTLARPTIRALVRDGARSAEPAIPPLVQRLMTRAGDVSLRTDLPAWPVVVKPPLRALSPPREIVIAATDTGPSAIHDVALLPGGRAAIALGEAGVRVLGRDGRALFHFDQPAHRLVVSDRGDRALALARRGDVWRVARLDLAQRKSEVWCEAQLDAFAPDFDGSQWLTARREELLVIDALDPRFSALRSTPIEGRAIAIGRTKDACSAVVAGGELARWRFELPSFTLRARRPLVGAAARDAVETRLGAASGDATALLERIAPGAPPARPSVQILLAAEARTEGTIVEVAPEDAIPLAVDVRAGFVAVATRESQGVVVRLLDDKALERRLVVTLAGARTASARLFGEALAIVDDRGRVVAIELAHGGLIRSQRV